MGILLKEYQRKTVKDILESAHDILEKDTKGLIILESPTGSGKTIMMAKVIEGMIKSSGTHSLCFIWVSIGKGELHIQSYRSLQNVFNSLIRCSLIEKKYERNDTCIDSDEVVITNWEKIRSKCKETGDWKNIIMREGDYTSFPEMIANTKASIVLIIDESHYSANTQRAGELRDLVNPTITIEMSATPIRSQIALENRKDLYSYIQVDYKDVIASGIIKKEILINPGIRKFSEEEDEQENQYVILGAAHQKRKHLKSLYEKEGSNINPLCLIQIPNSEQGDGKIDFITRLLSRLGVTEDNQKLAIWTSKYKSDHLVLKDLRSSHSDIEFLVFKQAIDTGWDCPRAHIWVKFRDIKSEVFAIQTLGRILRMPEQRHYETEELNTGYVYTTSPSIAIAKDEYGMNILKYLRTELRKEVELPRLVSHYKKWGEQVYIAHSFIDYFAKSMDDKLGVEGNFLFVDSIKRLEHLGFNMDMSTYQSELMEGGKVSVGRIDKGDLTDINYTGKVDLKLSQSDLIDAFKLFIKEFLGNKVQKRTMTTVMQAFYGWCIKSIGIRKSRGGFIAMKSFLLRNAPKFGRLFTEITEEYWAIRLPELDKKYPVYKYDWRPNIEELFNPHEYEIMDASKYLYQMCYLRVGRPQVEKNFELYLEKNAYIMWWNKNKDKGKDYLGIAYRYKNKTIRIFYPDYIVGFRDKSIGIFESKDGNIDPKIGDKAKVLVKYVDLRNTKSLPIVGGIVAQVSDQRQWRINRHEDYTYNTDDMRDWEYLDNVIEEMHSMEKELVRTKNADL